MEDMNIKVKKPTKKEPNGIVEYFKAYSDAKCSPIYLQKDLNQFR